MTAKMITNRAGRAEVEFKNETSAPTGAPAWLRDEPAWGASFAQPLGAKRRDDDEDEEDEDEPGAAAGGDLDEEGFDDLDDEEGLDDEDEFEDEDDEFGDEDDDLDEDDEDFDDEEEDDEL